MHVSCVCHVQYNLDMIKCLKVLAYLVDWIRRVITDEIAYFVDYGLFLSIHLFFHVYNAYCFYMVERFLIS